MAQLKHIYLPISCAEGACVTLDKTVSRRLSRVLRMREGHRFAVFNGVDGLFEAEIISPNAQEILLHKQIKSQPVLGSFTLAVALLKKEAMDRVLRQATEMGVTHIQPLLTDHVVATKLNGGRASALIIEASEQCERLSLPVLLDVLPVRDFVKSFSHNIFWCSERGGAGWCTESQENCAVLVGPEGGFSAEEHVYLENEAPKVIPVGLGKTILRADTAVVAALSRASNF